MRDNYTRCLEALWARVGDAELEKPNKRGARRLGISLKTLAAWRGGNQRDCDLNALNKGEASAILHIWFWRGVWADVLPTGVDHVAFCTAVGLGPCKAIAALQFILRVRPDSEMSARVVRAAEREDASGTVTRLCAYHRRHRLKDADAIEAEAKRMT
ncbi:MAG: glycosyl hydrolase 108 family protein [Methyloceanibacter sp.]